MPASPIPEGYRAGARDARHFGRTLRGHRGLAARPGGGPRAQGFAARCSPPPIRPTDLAGADLVWHDLAGHTADDCPGPHERCRRVSLDRARLDRLRQGAVAVRTEPAVFRSRGPGRARLPAGTAHQRSRQTGRHSLVYGALLTPKGMIVVDFWVLRQPRGLPAAGRAEGRAAALELFQRPAAAPAGPVEDLHRRVSVRLAVRRAWPSRIAALLAGSAGAGSRRQSRRGRVGPNCCWRGPGAGAVPWRC